jgi:3',5'-cyclic AMP phosphodiesterase CpdA
MSRRSRPPQAAPSLAGMTRRQALSGALTGAAAVAAGLALAGCGSAEPGRGSDGSTLHSTWIDPHGDGQLQVGPGEPLLDRVELGARQPLLGELARFAHITDAHVMDASSPARVPFLARLGPPLQSTFRPQEALTAQVLHGAINAVRALQPDVVIQGGDLIDNDQNNELEHALTLLRGGRISPGSGSHGYYGVQSAFDADPFYYRPDIDAPRHPGMLTAAVRPFHSNGLGAEWIPVLGDHDALVAGELVPSSLTRQLAVGDRALWSLPPHLRLPAGFTLNPTGSPDGPPDGQYVESFLQQALAGPTVRVPPDRTRSELSFGEVIERLSSSARTPIRQRLGATETAPAVALNYVRDVGDSLRLIVLDLVRREGGSGGLVTAGQREWLSTQLSSAKQRWVIVISHQPLDGTSGGEQLLTLMDQHPRVIAALAGHIHRNEIRIRHTPAGGYWLITTASLIDFPQQARALRLVATAHGGVALQTWMLDHVDDGRLGRFSRELSYLDATGGRPMGFSGTSVDRNVTLYRDAPAANSRTS